MTHYATVEARFLAKVAVSADPNACWPWQGASHGQGRGYGKFHYQGRTMSAHKVAYLIFVGPIREGMVVGHSCNNERCANPNHLYETTQSDNILYSVICFRHNSCKER